MRRLLSTAAMIAIGLTPLAAKPAAAQGYQIDCAILLCLAGGWPASVPCARARAEFIRRITPWPVEPPLQIWRCPMHAALETPDPAARLYRLAGFDPGPAVSQVPEMEMLHLAQAVGRGADIDVSGSAFAFIRSIDVFDASLSQGVVGEGEHCRRTDLIRHGSYDSTGQFRWRIASPGELPTAFQGDEGFGATCPSIRVRAVFVDWEDHEGTYGSEQVNY
ncbi:hypothetical protein [Roseovarius sp.]|uniref:hypothetical protein n=1 Tax=Roseovarius sp. TaxID=1486281 RepID=UPI001B503BEA|nr:hypothetical protein [Roseovarius sp.]MBQ0811825.1 hypothetical protein [Roseovarius sp.]